MRVSIRLSIVKRVVFNLDSNVRKLIYSCIFCVEVFNSLFLFFKLYG